jgi:hypothetical protein
VAELRRSGASGDTTAQAPDARAAALAMDDQHRPAEARGYRRCGVADMDHERAAADRVPSTHFGVKTGSCIRPRFLRQKRHDCLKIRIMLSRSLLLGDSLS